MDEMTITDSMMDEFHDALLERCILHNAPSELVDEIMRQKHGGICPTCGTAYEKMHVQPSYKNRLTGTARIVADFSYYQPRCWKDRYGEWKSCLERTVVRRDETGAEYREEIDHVANLLAEAGVPRRLLKASFTTWDYGDPENDEALKQVSAWTLEKCWLWQGLLLYGRVGTGKSHCAVAVLRHVLELSERTPIRFVPISGLVQKLVRREEDDYQRWILQGRIIVFDDLDKLSAASNEWVQIQFFHLIDQLINAERSMILTTNLDGAGLGEKIGHAVTSRLMGDCYMIAFAGQDYRPKLTEKGKV